MFFLRDNSDMPVSAILDGDGNQILDSVGIMSLSCNSSKWYAQHTLENGENMTDHAIDEQDRVNVTVILNPDDYTAVYREIKNLFNGLTKFTIQSKVETYSNMYLEAMPHEETASMSNTISLSLPFVQQKIGKTQTDTLPPDKVSNQSDSDTVKSGSKKPQPVKESGASGDSGTVLSRIGGRFL